MFLSLREIRHAKARYALLLVIMLLLTFLVLFVTGLARGLAYANGSAIENMPVNYFMLQKDSDNRFSRSMLDQTQLNEARSRIGKDKMASLGIRMSTITVDGGSRKTDIAVFGVDMSGLLAPDVIQGSAVADTDEGKVVADRKLEQSGVKIGSTIKDQATGMSWKVAGFTSDASYSHAPVVFMNELEWSKLARTSSMPGGPAEGAFNAIAVKGDKAVLAEAAGTMTDVDLISKKTAIAGIPGYSAEQKSLTMMIAFLFIIAAFVLTVFSYVITIQKTGQFGVLKAIGVKTSYLAGSVLTQMLLLSCTSVAISLLLTWGMVQVLPASMPFSLKPAVIAFTSLLMIAVSAAGALISVIRVAKIDALDAIGRAV
ncbi:ABC transporter permease [Paenibacillus caui]|uniref:ABC transporter permease n=1 Tax=Paenibacillus caui TaxID=2873927 RepID=UPI001CA97303|nr:ABC transporter permease [Paenibacillus caui]